MDKLKALASQLHINVDPKKIAARRAGARAWKVHERAVAGKFAPAASYGLHTPVRGHSS